MLKKIKRKAVEVMFVFSFALTGCGVESIVDSKRATITWIATAAVMIGTAIVLGGYINDDK